MPRKPVEPDYKRRLAMACSRGERQSMIISEMLAGRVQVNADPYAYNKTPWLTVGRCRVGWSSFRALRKRLIDVGFVFEVTGNKGKGFYGNEWILMIFPEENQ